MSNSRASSGPRGAAPGRPMRATTSNAESSPRRTCSRARRAMVPPPIIPMRMSNISEEPRFCHSSIIRPLGRPFVRIAILEDDPDQLALLRRWMSEDGHDVHAYTSGREAMKQAGRESFDLFVLDWQVPDVTGAEVLMWVRANVSKSVPVLFVTVRDSEQDIVFALEHGADDYMVKPVRRQELLARVHALLRRAYPTEEKKLLSFPPFEIDTQRNEVRKEGGKIELTPKEFELTVTLFRNMGRLMSRGHLQETVWAEAAISPPARWTPTSARSARSSTCVPN